MNILFFAQNVKENKDVIKIQSKANKGLKYNEFHYDLELRFNSNEKTISHGNLLLSSSKTTEVSDSLNGLSTISNILVILNNLTYFDGETKYIQVATFTIQLYNKSDLIYENNATLSAGSTGSNIQLNSPISSPFNLTLKITLTKIQAVTKDTLNLLVDVRPNIDLTEINFGGTIGINDNGPAYTDYADITTSMLNLDSEKHYEKEIELTKLTGTNTITDLMFEIGSFLIKPSAIINNVVIQVTVTDNAFSTNVYSNTWTLPLGTGQLITENPLPTTIKRPAGGFFNFTVALVIAQINYQN